MYQQLLAGICALFVASTSFAYIVDGSRISRPRLLAYAKSKLANHGVIEQNGNGISYLKVSDEYIRDLLHQIQQPDYQLPKAAHISIFSELEARNLSPLKELGQTVPFNPLGFYTIVVDDQEYLMLAVDAPELSNIRKKYGLSERLENHAFTVTIGVRKIQAHNELGNKPTG